MYELFEAADKKPGTYAALQLNAETKRNITKFLKRNTIPKPVPRDDMHCTLLHSTKHMLGYEPDGKLDQQITSTSTGFEIWPNSDKTANVLVLTLKCPQLVKRHKKLMKKFKGTHDFDEYKPHVTFSYDFGDNTLDDISKIDFDIVFDVEYSEPLNTD